HGIVSLNTDPSPNHRLLDPQPDIAAVPSLSTLSPHSQYVRTLVEEGVVGLVLVLALLGLSLLSAGREAIRAAVPERAPLAACAAAIAGFLIAAYVSDALRETAPFALVALVSGAAVTLAQQQRSARA